MRRLAAAAIVVTSLTACTPPETPKPALPRPPTDAELAVRIMRTYHEWQGGPAPERCSVYLTACADFFARESGFDPAALHVKNPRSFMQNPDPEWIPGWDSIPADEAHHHVAFAVLAHAATMRSFFTNCRRDFDAADLSRAEEAERLTRELGEIDKLSNVYARLGRLVTYRREVKRRFTDPVGPRYALELAVFDRFSKSGRGFLYELQNQRAEDAAALRPAFSTEEERDLFCMAAGVPTWQDADPLPAGIVARPITPERAAELEQKAKKAQDLEQKLPAAERRIPGLAADHLPDKGAEVFVDKEVLGTPLFVTQVKEGKDGVLVIDLAGKRTEKDVRLDCKPTDEIEKIENDKPVYAEECTKGDRTRELLISVRLPERPDVVVQKGDIVTLIGTVRKAETRAAARAPKLHLVHTLELDAVHLLEIWRDRLLVADYFVQ